MEEGFVYKRKPLDPNQEFVVVRVPDKLALGQLITEIRGERTMAQLAEQCNVSCTVLQVESVDSVTSSQWQNDKAAFPGIDKSSSCQIR